MAGNEVDLEGPKRGWRRPDASMSLLADLLSGGTALDPGYAEAAARRRARTTARDGAALPDATESAARPRRARRMLLAVRAFTVLLVVGALFAVATAQLRRSAPAAQRERQLLISAIQQRTAEANGLTQKLDLLRQQTGQAQAAQLALTRRGRAVQQELSALALPTGTTDVSGPGLLITVDDARSSGAAGRGNGHIFDHDLQVLINGLWAAGARAISVNGQRITVTTAVRSAGQAILVDFQPIGTPYVVSVLGTPNTIETTFEGSPVGQEFHALQGNFGIRFDVQQEDQVRVPASVTASLRYAGPVGGTG